MVEGSNPFGLVLATPRTTVRGVAISRTGNDLRLAVHSHRGIKLSARFRGIPHGIALQLLGFWLGLVGRAKRQARDNARLRWFPAEWVRAVNTYGGLGQWTWDVSFDSTDIAGLLDKLTTGQGD